MRCASAMLNGLACWVLQCASPSLFISLPFLPSALLASLPTSFSSSRSPLFLRPCLSLLSLSRLLSVEPRRVNTSSQDTLHSAPLSGGQPSALSQPEGKLIPRCSDGNVTWRVSSTTRLSADDGEKEENDEKAPTKEEEPAR